MAKRLHHQDFNVYAASCRWAGGNPEETDFKATTTLIKSAPETIARFVLLSSAGVDRAGQFPFFILNLFGTALQISNQHLSTAWQIRNCRMTLLSPSLYMQCSSMLACLRDDFFRLDLLGVEQDHPHD